MTKNVSQDDEIHLALGPSIDTGSEIRWFEQAFAEEIKLLRAAYDNIEIKWGLHRYYH